MRRAQRLVSHILRGAAPVSRAGGSLSVDYCGIGGLQRVAFFSSRTGPLFSPKTLEGGSANRRPSLALALAGALSFSVAAAVSFVPGDAEAKDRLPLELTPRNVVLYQYEACPFCNKVKAFLDYHDISYTVVEVNPISKKEIKWSDYKKVPILTVDGEPLVDSSDIITKLDSRIHPDTQAVGDNASSEENKWRRWVDDHLVHVLSPNIYRNTSEALEAFNYITDYGNFSTMERFSVKYAGAAAMYFVSKKLKKRHNITDERAALYEAAETWVEALDGRDFLGLNILNISNEDREDPSSVMVVVLHSV